MRRSHHGWRDAQVVRLDSHLFRSIAGAVRRSRPLPPPHGRPVFWDQLRAAQLDMDAAIRDNAERLNCGARGGLTLTSRKPPTNADHYNADGLPILLDKM